MLLAKCELNFAIKTDKIFNYHIVIWQNEIETFSTNLIQIKKWVRLFLAVYAQ